jgi:hypothetical protein
MGNFTRAIATRERNLRLAAAWSLLLSSVMHKLIPLLVLGVNAMDHAPAVGQETPARAVEVKSAEHEMFVRAIRDKQVLRFTYNGHVRWVEPHAYGVAATGETVLHAFQIEGESASTPPPGWRSFSVSLIEGPVVTERRFLEARPDYVKGEPGLQVVWAALEVKPAAGER